MSAKGVNPKPEHPFIHPIVQVHLILASCIASQLT